MSALLHELCIFITLYEMNNFFNKNRDVLQASSLLIN